MTLICANCGKPIPGANQPHTERECAGNRMIEDAIVKERQRLAEWIYKPENNFIRKDATTGDYVVFMPIHFLNRLNDGIFPSDEEYEKTFEWGARKRGGNR